MPTKKEFDPDKTLQEIQDILGPRVYKWLFA